MLEREREREERGRGNAKVQYLRWLLDIFSEFYFLVLQVSAVTDQPGMQDAGATTGDLDDDEGGGLVSSCICFVLCQISSLELSDVLRGVTSGLWFLWKLLQHFNC